VDAVPDGDHELFEEVKHLRWILAGGLTISVTTSLPCPRKTWQASHLAHERKVLTGA
jgi:hypothetical protein